MKLATELSKRATGKTLYLIDEPTTGLSFYDVHKLMDVMQRLVDKGNSIICIEHNLDVIRCSDWLIDLGPEGGDRGGRSWPAVRRRRWPSIPPVTPGVIWPREQHPPGVHSPLPDASDPFRRCGDRSLRRRCSEWIAIAVDRLTLKLPFLELDFTINLGEGRSVEEVIRSSPDLADLDRLLWCDCLRFFEIFLTPRFFPSYGDSSTNRLVSPGNEQALKAATYIVNLRCSG